MGSTFFSDGIRIYQRKERPVGSDLYPVLLDGTRAIRLDYYWARRRMFLIDKSTEDKSLPFCLGTRDTLVVPPHSFHPFSSFLYCAGSSFLGFIEARISQQHTGVIETIKD